MVALIGALINGFMYFTLFLIIALALIIRLGMQAMEEPQQTYRPAQHRPQYIPNTHYRQVLSVPRSATSRKN